MPKPSRRKALASKFTKMIQDFQEFGCFCTTTAQGWGPVVVRYNVQDVVGEPYYLNHRAGDKATLAYLINHDLKSGPQQEESVGLKSPSATIVGLKSPSTTTSSPLLRTAEFEKEHQERTNLRIWVWLLTSPGCKIDQELLAPFSETCTEPFLLRDHTADTSVHRLSNPQQLTKDALRQLTLESIQEEIEELRKMKKTPNGHKSGKSRAGPSVGDTLYARQHDMGPFIDVPEIPQMYQQQYRGNAGQSGANIQHPTFRQEIALLQHEKALLNQEQNAAMATVYNNGRNMTNDAMKAEVRKEFAAEQLTAERGRSLQRPDNMWDDSATKAQDQARQNPTPERSRTFQQQPDIDSTTQDQVRKQLTPERGRSLQRPDIMWDDSAPKAGQYPIPERGRTLQQQPNIMWNGPEVNGSNDSDVTTMSEIIKMGNARAGGARSMSRHKSPPKAATAMPPKPRPEPLNLKDARRYAALVGAHMNIHPVHHPVTPQQAQLRHVLEDGTSSIYDATPLGPPNGFAGSPQHVAHNPDLVGVNILKRYSEWRVNTDVANAPANYPTSKSSPERRNTVATPRFADQGFAGPSMSKSNGALPQPSPAWDSDMPPFTPLTPFIMGGNVRKASKTLIGEKGWLEDTAAGAGSAKKPQRQKTGFFKKTARKIVGMAEFKTSAPKPRVVKDIAISLDPREQSLLYCELQFLLNNAMGTYINAQFNSGRLDLHILAKISDSWAQQGRPKVVGFRYDLETQIELVTEHVGTFRFYGPDQTELVLVKAILYDMKMNARAMRIQTYCQPDSVIAKHILDSQRLLQLLDTPESMQISLEEVSQFFKVGIERENLKHIEKEMENQNFVPAPAKIVRPEASTVNWKASTINGKESTIHEKASTIHEKASTINGKANVVNTVNTSTKANTVNANTKANTVNANTKRTDMFDIPSPDDFPGARRVKNQASLPESQRHYSGPVLEPKTYDPPSEPPKSQRKKQGDQRRPPGN